MRPALPAALLSALIPVLFVGAPLLGAAPGSFLGHPLGDLADHVQGAWSWGDAVLAGDWPDHTTRSHFPASLPLVYPDPIGALLVTLLRPLGAAAAWNGAVLTQVGLTGLAGFGLGRDVLGGRRGGILVGVALGTSPTLLAFLHGGIAELVGLGPLILAIWALMRALGLGGLRRWPVAAAGLAVGLATTQSGYFGVVAGLFGLCALPGPGWRGRAGALARVGLVAGIAAAPGLWSMWTSLSPAGAVHAGNAPGWAPAMAPAVDLLGFLRPGAHYFPDTPALGNPGILHVHYIGAVLMGLATWGAWREGSLRARLGPVTLGMGLVALGPVLCLGGARLIPLPLMALYALGSPFSMVHHPYRLVVGLLPLVALFAGAGLRHLPKWAFGAVLVGILGETVGASPAPWPVAVAAAPVTAGLDRLGPGALLDWPPDATAANRAYQLAQSGHGRPIPYGVNVFFPDALREDVLVAALWGALDDPAGRARNRDVPGKRPRRVTATGPKLAGWGFAGIALHADRLTAAEGTRARAILTAALGAPVVEEGGVALFSISPGRPVPLR